jgi:hypothetical protein
VEGIPMQRILFCAAGALTLTLVAATTAVHAEERMPFTNHPVTGPYDATSTVSWNVKTSLPKCTIADADRRHYVRATIFGGTKWITYNPSCTQADFRRYEEQFARNVRELLGDPGKH